MPLAPPTVRAALLCGGVLAAAACRENLVPARGPAREVTISPESAAIAVGDSVRFTAVARNGSGSVLSGRTLAWSSTDTTVAVVRADGTALGVRRGEVAIVAAADSALDTALLRVQPLVAGVRIAPAGTTLVPGGRYPLAAFIVDPDGVPIARVDAQWMASDTTVARVAASGEVVAWSEGAVRVRAAFGALADSIPVRVTRVAFTAISAGPSLSTCASGPGGAFCWGSDGGYAGSLGTGAAVELLSTPVGVASAEPLTVVSVGDAFACGLTEEGHTYCWGNNAFGRLGSATSDSVAPSPTPVSGALVLSSISAGRRHACGLAPDAQLWCWGGNSTGALGAPITLETSPAPVAVESPVRFVSVGAGFLHTCALAEDGTAYCWGRGFQLGDSAGVTGHEPRPVHGARRYRELSVGWTHTCALAADSTAWCWGFNLSGESGTTAGTILYVPTLVEGAPPLAHIASGYSSTCGLTAAGEAWCWGWNTGGHLGTGDTLSVPTPRPAGGGVRFAALSAGNQHTCGIGLDGVAYCWGSAALGMLGDGTTEGVRTAPVRVQGQQGSPARRAGRR